MFESCEHLVGAVSVRGTVRLIFGVKECFRQPGSDGMADSYLRSLQDLTIDKLISSIIKQAVQVILADFKSQEVVETLKRNRGIRSLTAQDYLDSRHNA
ncbi:hypothetical protein EV421DRAFT_1868137 [Armillaria borealis]|uniref:Sin3 C-terminal domain-containing protein n=1 Tax=Armillaria borealis TaxID=47425 RepID=A0AA39ICJ5_9AGAR|nr:hypothetical protein EV421DRAFT_1868137 [Armillaria borealis]